MRDKQLAVATTTAVLGAAIGFGGAAGPAVGQASEGLQLYDFSSAVITGDPYVTPGFSIAETLVAESVPFVPPTSLTGTGLVSTVKLAGSTVTLNNDTMLLRVDRPRDPVTGAILGPTVVEELARDGQFLPGFGFTASGFTGPVQSLDSPTRVPVGNAAGQILAIAGEFDVFNPTSGSSPELVGIYRFDPGAGGGTTGTSGAVTVALTGNAATDAWGQPLPGGETWAEPTGGNTTRMVPRFNDAGQVLFTASLVAPEAEVPTASQAADAGVYLVPAPDANDADPDPRLVLRQDQPLPVVMDALLTNQPERFEQILTNHPEAEFEARVNLRGWESAYPALDPSGRAVLPVNATVVYTNVPDLGGGESVLFGSTALIATQLTGDPTNPVDTRLLVAQGEALPETSGAPGPGWTVSPFTGGLSVNGAGQTLYQGVAANADDTDERNGLFLHRIDPSDPSNRAADTNTAIVLNGDAVPLRFFDSRNPTELNALQTYIVSDQWAVTGPGDAVALGRAASTTDPRQRPSLDALLLQRADEETPTLLARELRVAPVPGPERLYRSIETFTANAAGDVAFEARLSTGAAAGASEDALFLYLRDDDQVVPVLLSGQTLELPTNTGDGLGTASYDVLNVRLGSDPFDDVAASNGLDGRPTYLDDGLRMAVRVFLQDEGTNIQRGATLELTFTPPPIRGDYDGDGRVAQGDLNLVLNNWGQPSSEVDDTLFSQLIIGEMVDQFDLTAVLSNWGVVASPTMSVTGVRWHDAAAVPEPATGLGLIAAAVGGWRLRRGQRA